MGNKDGDGDNETSFSQGLADMGFGDDIVMG